MKLTVFGGTGGTGRQFVEQALAGVYEVTAFVRNPSKLVVRHEHMPIIQGELHDMLNIERAINGSDVVISLLGPRLGILIEGRLHKEHKTSSRPVPVAMFRM